MRVPTSAIAAVMLSAASVTPLHAQSDEEIILADPAYSLTFAAGYVASDLNLWGKHGIKVKTVAITGIGAINSVISGSSHFSQASASSFGRASARGQKLIAIATTIDRPFAQVVLRKEIAEAGGYDAKSPLAKRGALLKGRTIAVDSINSMIHACAAGGGALGRQSGRHSRGADGARQHARGVPKQADRRLCNVAALAAEGGAGRRGGLDRQRSGRRAG
jgi:ABC-type nitrate/sulfonate/bicarbonate transport system substrate-binding protein